MKKILALLLASLLLIGLFAGCAKQETAPVQQEQTTTTEPAPAEQPAEQPSEQPENTELPTITFVHGYYHDESEWAAAAQMRQIYQDFADLHTSDYPGMLKKGTLNQLIRLVTEECKNIPESAKEKIMAENARRLFF